METNVRKQSFALAKVRIALSSLMCGFASCLFAESVTFQGHSIEYTNATVTYPDGASGDVVLTFASDGTFTLPGAMSAVRVLAVGGGGAGGSGAQYSSSNSSKYYFNGGNGGGGGGGVVDTSLYAAAGAYSVTVGAGGAAAASGTSTNVVGASGGASKIVADGASDALVEAAGGGGGGSRSDGLAGGSGGGGARSAKYTGRNYAASATAGGSGTDGQGFDGGAGNASNVGAGGGGAGAAGADASDGGAGGDGKASDITGTSVVYGGGGGGGRLTIDTAIAGGEGGGGVGGVVTSTDAGAGTDGLGGGGGGGGKYQAGTTAHYAIGGAGGKGIVIVRISAVYENPEKPAETCAFTYDGTEHVSISENTAYTITGTARATAAGTYVATATLKPELVASGFTWTDGETDPVEVTMTIDKASNAISGLKLESWIVGQAASMPSCTARFGAVKYTWSESEAGPWDTEYDAWTAGKRPTAVGTYYLHAAVEETDDYDGAEAIEQFSVWADPATAFTDHVTMTVSDLTSETLTDFPILVRISEGSVPGFLYSRAGATGRDIAFTSADGTKRYPHEVDVWNTAGESLVWVRVPSLTAATEVKMWWRLADGQEAPAYSSEEVWRAFAGVWHFSGTAASDILADASGNGLTATLESGASVKATTGGRIGSTALVSGGILTVADSAKLPNFASGFSFYGWVHAPGYGGSGPNFFWGKTSQDAKLVDETDGWLTTGWAMRLESKTSARWLWSGGSETKTMADVTGTDGGLLGFVYDGTAGSLLKCAMFTSESEIDGATATPVVAADSAALRLAAGGFALDEIRLSATALSEAWMKAEYLTVADPTKTAFGYVSRDGLLVDWWKTEASITKTSWHDGEGAGEITVPVPSSGRTVRQTFVDLSDPETALSGMPTAEGCYRVIFDFEDDETYEPLTASLDFQILASASSYDDLQGDAATLTLSGRVLLMNDDTVAGHAVTDQGYWQGRRYQSQTRPVIKYTTNTTFWVHSGTHSAGSANGTYRAGVNHDLVFSEVDSSETNTIWSMSDVLVGSPYTTATDGLGGRCALPFSATARQISTRANSNDKFASDDLREVGNIVFRNVVSAEVRSQQFTNGVGTVYFDAVNLKPTDGASTSYSLAVEVETDDADWTPVKLVVLKCDGDAGISLVRDDIDRVDLNATVGDGDRHFYRIAAPVNERTPCSIRIRRVSIDSNFKDDPDLGGLILADNIVVSPPKMTADVVPFGEFDAGRLDGGAVGSAGAMSVPFPGAGETVYGRAKVEAWTGGAASVDPNAFVSVSRLNYRWRYLDQKVGEWKQSLMTSDGAGGLKAFEPLDLPAAEGDVEFWFESSVSIPYYELFDYSGTGLGMGGLYSETAGDTQTNRLSLASGETLPSCGRDWFFRVRPAASAYERMRVITAETDDGPATTNEMELAASGSWRGFVPTLTAPEDGMLRFRIEGINPQAEGAAEYALSTNAWVASETLAETPAETGLATWTSGWAKAPCDAKTGHLLFQVNEPSADSAGKLLVARADRQDFNLWSSGISTNGLFVGTSVDTNSTTQVTQTRALDFTTLGLSTATNENWKEDFSLGWTGIVSRAYYPRNVPFANSWTCSTNGDTRTSTRRGWTPQNAMWTYGRWSMETASGEGDETALQLQGRGAGVFSFESAASAPDGLDTVEMSARLAQYNEFENFSYFDGIVVPSEGGYQRAVQQTRFTLLTQLAMTESGEASFDGDGSVSLVGYLHPEKGGYEFRISRGMTTNDLKLALYKWSRDGHVIKPTLLGTNIVANCASYLVRDDLTELGAAFISVEPDGIPLGSKTRIVCGLFDGTTASNTGGYRANVTDKNFQCIAYVDADSPLTAGTYGVLARNCPGVFVDPISSAAPRTPTGTDKTTAIVYPGDNEFKAYSTAIVTFDADGFENRSDMDEWILKSGRTEALTGHGSNWGMQAVTDISQTIIMETSPRGENAWTPIATNEVTSFADQTFKTVVQTTDKCDVRFRVGGTQDDERIDVVIKEVELTQWAAQTTTGFSTDALGRTNEFVYTQAWLVPGEGDRRAVRLQPARASNSSQSVAMRTPALSGLGLVGFSWRNADENAVLHLQFATNASPREFASSCRSWTEAASDSANWTTLETLRFTGEGASPTSGHKTVPLAVRAPSCGAFRLVVDRSVVSTARGSAGKADPLYGSVEIVDFYAWDLPAYDARSWTGWNFRTAGWADRAPGPFANLRDAWTGLSGLLNNTLDVDTLADKEPVHYALRQPSIQSPTFATNCVGSVEFRARLYDASDPTSKSPHAVVTVYGADLVDASGEPTHWEAVGDVLVTNSVYDVYTMKFSNSRNFYALRLGVKGVSGVSDSQVDGAETPVYDPPLRVAIDDVAVWEKAPLAVAFRLDRVRPFRSATALKGLEAVADIDSAEEQPLAGETFGFQAEVVVRDTDEIVTDDPSMPVSVTLWYYPSAEPWGFDNWKTNSGAVSVELEAAEGTNLVFRSTVANTLSMCPPQLPGSDGYGVVQYQMVATFYDRSGEQFTNAMSSSEWSMPSWNDGFDDPNAKGGATFSAFTVLETIAPGRAWINEVNYVERERSGSDVDQWVELAVPAGVSMTNWVLRLYDMNGNNLGPVVRLGQGCPGVKNLDPVNRYSFYLVQGPKTRLAGADATWSAISPTTGSVSEGVLHWNYPFGFELVRPSGIVEHRVVAQGNNTFGRYIFFYQYEGTNLVRVLNESTSGGWVWSAADSTNYVGCTIGVTNSNGHAHEDWAYPLGRTPGAINEGQVIDPDWFTRPNSGFCWVDAVVGGAHLRQVVGGVTNTATSFSVESGKSTNLVYEVDRWYRLGTPSVVPATTATTVAGPVAKGGKSYYTLTFPELTNDVRVTASAIVDPAVEPYLADVGAYRPAILKWLEDNADTFKGDTIKTAKYRGSDGSVDDDIGLKGLYWFDLDPTEGGWELWGGMGEKGGGSALGTINITEVRENPWKDDPRYEGYSMPSHTNVLTTVWLMLTNTVSGEAHPPTRLQGLGNERSDTFSGVWTSVTFKVEMQLCIGELKGVFRPMRYFVFDSGSFRPATDATAPFASRIEVTDPFSRQSPAWEWGWWKYSGESTKPWTRWNLNEDISPGGVSTLKASDLLAY